MVRRGLLIAGAGLGLGLLGALGLGQQPDLVLDGAEWLARHGYPERAAGLFERARRTGDADAASLARWGRLLMSAGRPAAAVQAFEQAVGIAGPGTPLHLEAARARLATGDARAALNHLGRLYQKHGHEPVVGFLTGKALLATGNPGAARRALERAWHDLDKGGDWLWKPQPVEIAEAFDQLGALYAARGWETLRKEVEERKRRALEPSG